MNKIRKKKSKRDGFHPFRNMSLANKILVLILASALLSVVIMEGVLFVTTHRMSLENQEKDNTQVVLNASSMLNNLESGLITHFVNICSEEDFVLAVKSLIEQPDQAEFPNQILDSYLTDLSYANYLVNSAIIVINGSSSIYTTRYSPVSLTADELFPNGELEQVRGITWLPQRASPFILSSTVIPVVVPLYFPGNYMVIDNDENATPDLFVIFLIDYNSLENVLFTGSARDESMDACLIRSDGTALTYEPDGSVPSVLEEAGLQEILTEMLDLTSEDTNYTPHLLSTDSGSYFISVHNLRRDNLYVLSSVHKVNFFDYLQEYAPALLPTFLAVVCIIIAVAIFMSKFVTKPMQKLVEIVGQIERGQYTEKVTFNQNDEVGHLLDAINNLYDTTVRQMKQIREDESEKYRTELKLMTEQINPHFLYNTLEVIQSEVVRGNRDIASSMIHSLAEYLRIGLSGGADLIPIRDEIQHAVSYVSIMNQRFGQNIMFVNQYEPALASKKILKTILQPMLENSIRHGFGIDSNGMPISIPTIEVYFRSPSAHILTIEISDNGSGFDADHVRKIMTKPATKGQRTHIGINNTWLRLVSFYGKDNVDVRIESIPYYRNSFFFTIRNFDMKEGTEDKLEDIKET